MVGADPLGGRWVPTGHRSRDDRVAALVHALHPDPVVVADGAAGDDHPVLPHVDPCRKVVRAARGRQGLGTPTAEVVERTPTRVVPGPEMTPERR